MKKRLALALFFVFSVAVFTPALAMLIDNKAVVEVLADDNKDKKEKKSADKACTDKKADKACTSAEKKACGDKKAEAKTDCSKKTEKACCSSKKAE